MALTRKIVISLLGGALIVIGLSIYVSWTWEQEAKEGWSPEASKIKSAQIQIKDRLIQAEIAATTEEHYLGLSGRKELCADCGLLFSFPDRQERFFVMREMNFPLDIIFIDQNRIISLASDLLPEGKQPENIYASGEPVQFVLELNGGYSAAYNFQVGDQVEIIYED